MSSRELSSRASSVELEYEDTRTIEWIRGELARFGKVMDFPWGPDFVDSIAGSRPDVLFNITEATGGRNRESLVPAVAEALSIPYTGSDPLALGISLDKHLAKLVAASAGVEVPGGTVIRSDPNGAPRRIAELGIGYPVIVKPVTGGSSVGILERSLIREPAGLPRAVEWVLERCGSPALVERFIAGRELTVSILEGPDGTAVFPLAELVFDGDDPFAFYSAERKSMHRKEIRCPAEIGDALAEGLTERAMAVYGAVGCRDLARVDFRLDREGRPYFLEINPLPGLSPYYGIYPVQAKAAGVSCGDIFGRLIGNALGRGGKA